MEFKNFRLVKQKNGLIKTVITGPLSSWADETLYEDPKEVEKHFKNQKKDFERYAKETVDFIGLDFKNKSLLDIGTGFGWLVAEANKRGYWARGIDISNTYIAAGRRYLKVDLKVETLKQLARSHLASSFDVVVLKHVLEHIENLKDFFGDIKKIIKPDGILVIAVPNIFSLMFLIFKERWYGLQPGQHIWQFTPKSLNKLLLENGFILKKQKVFSLDYQPTGWKRWAFSLLVQIGNLLKIGDQLICVYERRS